MATVEVISKNISVKCLPLMGWNLATKEGEFLVLLGPSGCGKTTLMRMIAGLEKPTAGDILMGGQIVTICHRGREKLPWCSRAMPSTLT